MVNAMDIGMRLHPSDMPAFLSRLAAEVRNEYRLRATVEYPAHLQIIDSCNRLICIGRETDSTLRADVYQSSRDHAEGYAPVESDHLQGETVPLLVLHALAIANRVACKQLSQ